MLLLCWFFFIIRLGVLNSVAELSVLLVVLLVLNGLLTAAAAAVASLESGWCILIFNKLFSYVTGTLLAVMFSHELFWTEEGNDSLMITFFWCNFGLIMGENGDVAVVVVCLVTVDVVVWERAVLISCCEMMRRGDLHDCGGCCCVCCCWCCSIIVFIGFIDCSFKWINSLVL